MSLPELLGSTDGPLREVYNGLLVDLDGVVQLGDQPIPGAAEALAAARDRGARLAFVTNNAARTAADVVAALARLDVAATAEEVVTSSMAAADVLIDKLSPGTRVLVVGGPGLWAAVADAGLTPVPSVDVADPPSAVVQGWGPDVAWADLAEATVALRAGAWWVATNRDRTLPSPRGPLPGSGSLIAAVEAATGRAPDVIAGKPSPALFTTASERVGGAALMVGDRLDTDIAGARAAGVPSLLVLTGASGPADLLAAPPEERPTFVGRDLGALAVAHPVVTLDGDSARCRDACVSVSGAVERASSGDPIDGLRAAATLAWAGVLPSERYAEVLSELGLD